LNRGYGGYNTEWVLRILPDILRKVKYYKVTVVTVFLGANDAVLSNINAKQHVSLENFRRNLEIIHDKLAKDFNETDGNVKVVFITPPCFDESEWAEYRKEQGTECDRTNNQTVKYAETVKEVAKELDRPCLDAFSLILDDAKSTDTPLKEYFCDGLHFSSKGNLLLGAALVDLLSTTWPDTLNPTNIKMEYPHHEEVDHMDLNRTFGE
jgi:lysophospholipase L1-like esterase